MGDFFQIASATIAEEDRWIRRQLMEKVQKGRYRNWPWPAGLLTCYETGLVYQILKGLWMADFRWEVGWELSYPDWRRAKLDLGIFKKLRKSKEDLPALAIEVKVLGPYKTEEKLSQKVWKEAFKLLWYYAAEARYLLLIALTEETGSLNNRSGGAFGDPDPEGWHRFEKDVEKNIYDLNFNKDELRLEERYFIEFSTSLETLEGCDPLSLDGTARISLVEVLPKGKDILKKP